MGAFDTVWLICCLSSATGRVQALHPLLRRLKLPRQQQQQQHDAVAAAATAEARSAGGSTLAMAEFSQLLLQGLEATKGARPHDGW